MIASILIFLTVALLLGLYFWYHRPTSLRAPHNRQSAEVCLVLLQLIQELQRHRGLSIAVLDGQAGFDEELDATERALQESLYALAGQYGENHAVFGSEQWHVVLGQWNSLRNHWRDLDFVNNLLAHNEIVLGLISVLQESSVEASGRLGRERIQIITQWVPLIEHMGMLRALGMHLLSLHNAEEDARLSLLIVNHRQYVRQTLTQLADKVPDRALMISSKALVRRLVDLTGTGQQTFNAQTFYEEMTAMIDQWYRMITMQLTEVRPSRNTLYQQMKSHRRTATKTRPA